jgi:hypothetical protein
VPSAPERRAYHDILAMTFCLKSLLVFDFVAGELTFASQRLETHPLLSFAKPRFGAASEV